MPTLLLTLSGPLQAWGVTENGAYRDCGEAPSLSGVIGLVASALGRDRFDPLDDLYSLNIAVRTDIPGQRIVDMHTTQPVDEYSSKAPIYEQLFNGYGPSRRLHDQSGGATMQRRGYLTDAVFVAALSGDSDSVRKIAKAVRRPKYPLFLGRRSCPAEPLYPVVVDTDDPVQALREYEFQGFSPVRAKFDNDGSRSHRLRNGKWGVPSELRVDYTPSAEDSRGATVVRDRHLVRQGWHRSFTTRKRATIFVPPVVPRDDDEPIGFS